MGASESPSDYINHIHLRRVSQVKMPMKRKMSMKKNTDTEAITPPIHPKPHQIPYSLAHIRILPIEIGLFCNKKVEVILVRWLVVLPRRACNVISVCMAGGMVHQSFRGTIIGGRTFENGFPIIGRLVIPRRVVYGDGHCRFQK
jgi:hypothetical protein